MGTGGRGVAAQGNIEAPPLAAGGTTERKPPEPAVADGQAAGETFWQVRAVLARDTAWAAAGHQVARGRWPAPPSAQAPPGAVGRLRSPPSGRPADRPSRGRGGRGCARPRRLRPGRCPAGVRPAARRR
ncbi:DUF4981 domain-containing protein [Streptomyces sp. NPDC005722]